jgi:hypothetical protein
MDDIYRYISEALRIRRAIQVFSEFFENDTSIDALSKDPIEIGFMIQRSMHDEILISLTRLFDTDAYTRGKTTYEYLSQRNLLESYSSSITPEIAALREETAKLWADVSIRDYRDLRVAHNDKSILTGRSPPIKHNISFDSAKKLTETSMTLMIKLLASITGKSEIPLREKIDEHYVGKGKAFISRLRT